MFDDSINIPSLTLTIGAFADIILLHYMVVNFMFSYLDKDGFVLEKKDFRDSKFWKLYTLAGNGSMVNLMFLICSLPVVTMGAAWCGLFSSMRFAIRGDGWLAGFKEGLCTRFWRMVIAWIICLGVVIYMAINIVTMLYYKNEGYIPMLIAYSAFLLIARMIAASLIVLNVYIPTSVVQWLKNANSSSSFAVTSTTPEAEADK